MTRVTPERRAELKALAEATPDLHFNTVCEMRMAELRFYNEARTALPDLLADQDGAEARAQRAEAEVERLKAERQAVITLLYSDQIFVGSDWEEYPKAGGNVWPTLCAHAANFGADAEAVPPDWWIPLANMIEKHGFAAVEAWVCYVRKIDKPAKGKLTPEGQQALDDFRANTPTYGLISKNYCDRLTAAKARATRLDQRVRELEAALKPLATFISVFDWECRSLAVPLCADDDLPPMVKGYSITAGDLRAAARVLATTADQDEGDKNV